MKNQEHIEYTYKHRKIVMYLANKYVKEEAVLKQIQNHDIDKLFMYLFYNKKILWDDYYTIKVNEIKGDSWFDE